MKLCTIGKLYNAYKLKGNLVEEIEEIPKGAHAIFSAHGYKTVRKQAEQSLEVVDLPTCN